jgi:hypothetical protein
MEQISSLEGNSHSAGQEITHLLWNPKVHYRVHNSLPLVPFLNQMHLVHTFPLHFPKINSNIILPSTPRSSDWSLPFRFYNQPSNVCYMSAHLILLIFGTYSVSSEQPFLILTFYSCQPCYLLQIPEFFNVNFCYEL